MNFEVEALPYAQDALAPAMSAETFSFHFEKHHKGYMKKLEGQLGGTDLASKSLEELVKSGEGQAHFNNAAQVWNHTFFWKSLKPNGGGEPTGDALSLINNSFGSADAFKAEWKKKGGSQFGSGWVWLVQDGDKANIVTTSNAGTPLANGQKALLTTDVWEHAYYIDHRNNRGAFLDVVLEKLINWDFINENLRA